MSGFFGGLRLTEPVVELHEQALCKGLACAVDAAVVEDLGMLATDSHGVCRPAVQIRALTPLALKGHPAKSSAA